MVKTPAGVDLKTRSEFLCSQFGSPVFTPPASLRKYYDCTTQTIFVRKNVLYGVAANSRTYRVRLSIR